MSLNVAQRQSKRKRQIYKRLKNKDSKNQMIQESNDSRSESNKLKDFTQFKGE